VFHQRGRTLTGCLHVANSQGNEKTRLQIAENDHMSAENDGGTVLSFKVPGVTGWRDNGTD
jgi:hypothetical protein